MALLHKKQSKPKPEDVHGRVTVTADVVFSVPAAGLDYWRAKKFLDLSDDHQLKNASWGTSRQRSINEPTDQLEGSIYFKAPILSSKKEKTFLTYWEMGREKWNETTKTHEWVEDPRASANSGYMRNVNEVIL